MSSVGSFFSYVNDARSHEPEVGKVIQNQLDATITILEINKLLLLPLVGSSILLYLYQCAWGCVEKQYFSGLNMIYLML